MEKIHEEENLPLLLKFKWAEDLNFGSTLGLNV